MEKVQNDLLSAFETGAGLESVLPTANNFGEYDVIAEAEAFIGIENLMTAKFFNNGQDGMDCVEGVASVSYNLGMAEYAKQGKQITDSVLEFLGQEAKAVDVLETQGRRAIAVIKNLWARVVNLIEQVFGFTRGVKQKTFQAIKKKMEASKKDLIKVAVSGKEFTMMIPNNPNLEVLGNDYKIGPILFVDKGGLTGILNASVEGERTFSKAVEFTNEMKEKYIKAIESKAELLNSFYDPKAKEEFNASNAKAELLGRIDRIILYCDEQLKHNIEADIKKGKEFRTKIDAEIDKLSTSGEKNEEKISNLTSILNNCVTIITNHKAIMSECVKRFIKYVEDIDDVAIAEFKSKA